MATTVAKLMIELDANTSRAQANLKGFNTSLGGTGKAAGTAGKQMGAFGLNLDRAATRLGSITRLGGVAGNVLSLGVAAGFAGAAIGAVGFGVAMQKAVASGIAFESAFTGIEKTVNASTAQLGQIREEIIDLSTVIPQTAIELSKMGEVAGQLNVQAEDIVSFTRTVADVGVATNIAATDAATGLARLTNITQGSFDEVNNLASAMVELGNNSATTEQEILTMSLRIAGAGHQVGLTQAEILGFAAALSSLGVRSEQGGSAISRTFIEIDKAVSQGGEKLIRFAQIAGLSAQEFSKLWGDDAAAAVVMFSEGLGRLDEAGEDIFTTLEDVGLAEIRVRDALLRLANSGDLASRSINMSNEAFEENIALTEEAERRYATTESKIQLFKNSVNALAIDAFDVLKPSIDETVEALTDLVQGLGNVTGQLEGASGAMSFFFESGTSNIRMLADFVSMGGTVVEMLADMNTGTSNSNIEMGKFLMTWTTVPGLMIKATQAVDGQRQELERHANAIQQAREIRRMSNEEEAQFRAGLDETTQRVILITQSITDGYARALVHVTGELRNSSDATTDHTMRMREAGAAGTDFTASQQRIREELLATNTVMQQHIAQQNMLIDTAPRAAEQVSGSWDQIFSAATRAMEVDPENLTTFMETLVEGVRTGQVEIERVFGLIGDLPEDTTDELITSLEELKVGWLETAGSMESTSGEIRDAEGNIRVLDQVINELAASLEGIGSRTINLQASFSVAGEAIDIFNNQTSETRSRMSALEDTFEIINKKKEEGIELSDAEQQFLERYPELYAQMEGGLKDSTTQAGLWAAAQEEVVSIQHDINAGLDGMPGRIAGAARSIQDLTSDSGLLNDKQAELLEKLLGVNVTLEGLDGQEANIAVNLMEGGGGTAGQRGGPTRFEQRAADLGITGKIRNAGEALVNLDGSTATVTANITDNATVPLDGISQRVQWLQQNGSFTLTANLDTSAFDAGVAHIAANTPRSPAKEGPLSVEPNWDYLFEGLEASADKYTEEGLEHLQNYVNTAKSIFDTLSAELDFAGQAAEFQTGEGVLPGADFIADLSVFSADVTQQVGESAALFEEEFLEHAETYSSAAKSSIALLNEAVGFVSGLEGVTIDLESASQAASDLKFLTEHIVLSIGDSAQAMTTDADHPAARGEGFIGIADSYAQGAKSSVELIGAGVSELVDLDTFSVNLSQAKRAATDLKFLTEHIVLSIGDSAQVINSDADHPASRGEGFVGIAADYAEGAEKAVSLVSEGLGFISDLSEFEGRFNLDQSKEFASNLKFLIEHIALSIGDSAAILKSERPEDFLEGMDEYAEATLSSLELLGSVVDVLSQMNEMGEEIPSAEQVKQFAKRAATDSRVIAEAFREAAENWGTDPEGEEGTVNAELSNFAEGADMALGTLGNVFDVLEGIAGLGEDPLTPEQVRMAAQRLSEQVRIIAEEFKIASQGWDEADESLANLAEDAGNSLGLVGDAVDAIKAMMEFHDSEGEPFDIKAAAKQLASDIRIMIDTVREIADEYSEEGVEGWADFNEAAKSSFDMVSSATKAFEGMAEMSKIGPKQAEIFLHNYQIVIDVVGEIANMLSTQGIDNAEEALEAAEQIADIMNAATDAIESISPPSASSSGGEGGSGGGGTSVGGGGGGSSSSGSGGNVITQHGLFSVGEGDLTGIAGAISSLGFGVNVEVDQDAGTLTATKTNQGGLQEIRNAFRVLSNSGAYILIDEDGLRSPESGFVLNSDPLYVNAFDRGSYILEDQAALVHRGEYITPERSIPKLAEEIADSLVEALQSKSGMMGEGGVHIYLDGREITENALTYLDSGTPAGWSIGP